jgi:hypothetical protein
MTWREDVSRREGMSWIEVRLSISVRYYLVVVWLLMRFSMPN